MFTAFLIKYAEIGVKGKNRYLFEDALKANGAGELAVYDGAHDACQVIEHDKQEQRVQKPVTAAQKPAEPAADACENDLNSYPEFLHNQLPP